MTGQDDGALWSRQEVCTQSEQVRGQLDVWEVLEDLEQGVCVLEGGGLCLCCGPWSLS